MANLVNLWSETNIDIITDDSSPTLSLENTSSGSGLKISVAGAAPAINALLSSVSGAVIKLNNANYGYVTAASCASMRWAMAVNVGGVLNYIPVYGLPSFA